MISILIWVPGTGASSPEEFSKPRGERARLEADKAIEQLLYANRTDLDFIPREAAARFCFCAKLQDG
jgi:hypothetical protein